MHFKITRVPNMNALTALRSELIKLTCYTHCTASFGWTDYFAQARSLLCMLVLDRCMFDNIRLDCLNQGYSNHGKLQQSLSTTNSGPSKLLCTQ